jgi:cyanophycinase-like exopeptidase
MAIRAEWVVIFSGVCSPYPTKNGIDMTKPLGFFSQIIWDYYSYFILAN